MNRLASVALTLALAALGAPAQAQPASPQPAAPQAPATPADPHAGHVMEQPAAPADPHAGHVMEQTAATPSELPPFIPRLTDEDRRAAFPETEGHHAAHDQNVNYFVLLDQLEWQGANGDSVVNVNTTGWVGRDRDRVWFRVEGDAEDATVNDANAHVLYGHQFSRWWDLVAGMRQDVRPGAAQTWAAIGLQGLAPYWFEVEATAYVGASGRTMARFEADYDLRLTNRVILQPLAELELQGKSDPDRRVGAGLSTTDVGIRLRFLLRREFAPYVGVTWARKWGGTADYAEADGEQTRSTRLVTGIRLWF